MHQQWLAVTKDLLPLLKEKVANVHIVNCVSHSQHFVAKKFSGKLNDASK